MALGLQRRTTEPLDVAGALAADAVQAALGADMLGA
jgi:hypothetical protein